MLLRTVVNRSIGVDRVGCAACRTDEIDDEAAVGEAAGGVVEEGLAVGRPERGLPGVVGVDEAVVARVRQWIPKAEHPRVARRIRPRWMRRRQYQ